MYTYILRCKDNSLYCGYTTDISRREEEHKNKIGSKYVRAHGFKKLELYIVLESKSLAMKMECAIKKLSKGKKEKLIQGDDSIIDKLDIDYISINRLSADERK
ncbi:GIY-YIG nuclease family protein [Peptostreptococcus russellii]|uniref:GIY-YIG nuclease family protein n=1 Tax=Peptostreptococcus russellii TaxID=215200 RepID=UPI0016247DA8|nr:GIY-YIG nuclease family protein [Peptostreptococcus russellii]